MSCSLLVEDALQAGDAAHDLVRRRLVHAALDVGARVDADHVARRRNRIVGDLAQVRRIRIGDQQPRVIERRVFRVELLPLVLHVGERVQRRPWAVEHGEAIAHQLAMVDQRALHHRGVASRTGDDADLFDIAQAVESAARLRVLIVLTDIIVFSECADGIGPAHQVAQRMARRTPAAIRQDIHQSFRTETDVRAWIHIAHAEVP